MQTPDPKNISRLRHVPLFQHLPDEALAELAENVTPVHWEKDTVVYRKGDPGDSLFIILGGWVKIVTEDARGEELVLNHCGPGQAIGDVALIDGEPRSASVVALLPVNALELTRDAFIDALTRQPQLGFHIMRGLSARIRLSTTYIEKAIEWSHAVGQGDYSFMEQLDAEHKTVVTMSRSDEARVGEFLSAFFRMVEGVKAREDELRAQLRQLTIQIDEDRRKRDVEEIKKSDFFQGLKSATQRLRKQREDNEQEP